VAHPATEGTSRPSLSTNWTATAQRGGRIVRSGTSSLFPSVQEAIGRAENRLKCVLLMAEDIRDIREIQPSVLTEDRSGVTRRSSTAKRLGTIWTRPGDNACA
jgi:hypothetical protein